MTLASSNEKNTGSTPGPWTIQTIRDRYIWIRAGEVVVAEINGSNDPDDDRVEADARLIAAAPELRQTTGELHRLLREWRRTPFFEDATEWQRWVDDFGARVDQATDVAVTVLRKVTEDRP